MLRFIRTNNQHPDFKKLVAALDADLQRRDGEEAHVFYAQFNKLDQIKYVIVAYEGDRAVSCGAIKEYEPGSMEVKRMYTDPAHRGKGIASGVLAELENWSRELQHTHCILETGKNQPEAIRLYQKNGYRIIPNFGQYAEDENSVCFEKMLDAEF